MSEPPLSRDEWGAVKSFLVGAVQQVEKRLTPGQSETRDRGTQLPYPYHPQCSDSVAGPSGLQADDGKRKESPAITEHRRLFGYKPDVSWKKTPFGKRTKRAKVNVWKKDTLCLRYTDQTKGPDTEERMELAKMGLGLRELKFNVDGDALHIHDVLMEEFGNKIGECMHNILEVIHKFSPWLLLWLEKRWILSFLQRQ